MKYLIKCVLVFYLSVLISKTTYCQEQKISDYIGTWRWVSGNKDTFLIVLMKNPKITNLENDLSVSNLIGYHTYIERGQLIESNMQEIGGKEADMFSITGVFKDNSLITGFRDFTRDSRFTGTLKILKDFPNKALWSQPFMAEKYIYYGIGIWERPNGRTVPDNIVLEKIK